MTPQPLRRVPMVGEMRGLPAHRFSERAKQAKEDREQGTGSFAFDLDGTIDAFPRPMASLVCALTATAHRVYIVTGVTGDQVTSADIEAKRDYLTSLGLGPDTYTELIVVPDPHGKNKRKALEQHKVGVLVDNDKKNVKKAAKSGVVSLLLWNAKES